MENIISQIQQDQAKQQAQYYATKQHRVRADNHGSPDLLAIAQSGQASFIEVKAKTGSGQSNNKPAKQPPAKSSDPFAGSDPIDIPDYDLPF